MKNSIFWKLIGLLNFLLPSFIRRKYIRKQEFNVLSGNETLKKLKCEKCSFARFGDGEISILIGKKGPSFQKSNSKLRKELWDVFKSSNILIGWPGSLNQIDGINDFWLKYRIKNFIQLLILSREFNGILFGDSQITRPYIRNCKKFDKYHFDAYFDEVKNLFDGKDILIIEGTKTRFGVGNDLLSKSRSIRRILVPSVNASKKYLEILDLLKGTFNNSYLYLLACGPLAKILVSDLAKRGEVAWDLGHLDIEYEWFVRGVKEKIPIPGKYVNETKVKFDKSKDIYINDKNYQSQIICKVK